jgi:hypothetical protein
LKNARIEAGLTQEQADDRLGIYHSFTRRNEHLQRRVDFVELLKYIQIYSKSADYFLMDVSEKLEKK